ncbi:MAG: hypothetical protein AB1473_00645 [Thermodesulfobacteriota bacterium]
MDLSTSKIRSCRMSLIAAVVVVAVGLLATSVSARTPGPTRGPAAALPPGLFVASAPPNAIDVGHARKVAQEGKPIVLRGRIGGLAKPFAEKHAMFVLSDMQLAACAPTCSNPGDYCSIPREQLLANLATVQVVDANGMPLRAPMQGMNGLQPMSEVVIRGIVAKRDSNVLIVNAHNIYVNQQLE